MHKGFAFILFENNDFYENIKKFKGKHVIDDEEVICVLAGERKSLLLTDANATPFDSKNSSGMDVSKGNPDNEVGKVQFIRNEKNVKEKEIKHGNNPKIISTNSVDFQDSKKRTKETSLSQKLPKIDEWKGRSEKNSLFEKVANMKLTDLVRENEGGNEMYKKTNVRPWNSSHVSVTRNGFSGRNNSSNRSFRVPTVETVKQKYFEKGIEFRQSVGSSASFSGQSTS